MPKLLVRTGISLVLLILVLGNFAAVRADLLDMHGQAFVGSCADTILGMYGTASCSSDGASTSASISRARSSTTVTNGGSDATEMGAIIQGESWVEIVGPDGYVPIRVTGSGGASGDLSGELLTIDQYKGSWNDTIGGGQIVDHGGVADCTLFLCTPGQFVDDIFYLGIIPLTTVAYESNHFTDEYELSRW